MNTTAVRDLKFNGFMHRISLRRGLAFGIIIVVALLAFEIFNYSTTVFALSDLLGDLDFAGLRWATILAIAFCGIDFAGIARLFTPEEGANEPTEVWYLFGAWLLAATMNAMLTWWGVSIALLNRENLGNAVVERETLLRIVPIFVATLVWLIRVMIIGTFSVAGDRLFSQADRRIGQGQYGAYPLNRPNSNRVNPSVNSPRNPNTVTPVAATNHRSAYKSSQQSEQLYSRPEPTYHPLTMSARSSGNSGTNRSSLPPNR
ncbi:MAG TPA: hypothetical protein VI755_04730 [Anaerolineales bacterium]|nr:hypothetical protein [Anaerolineales bacterium]